MTNRLIRNGWWAMHVDAKHATKLSDGEQFVRTEVAKDQTEVYHWDPRKEHPAMVTIRMGDTVAFTGFGKTQKYARADAVRQARYHGYEPRDPDRHLPRHRSLRSAPKAARSA